MQAQMRASDLMQGNERVDIPFTYRNGFIIVEVKFNDFMPMSFIFDTGAEHTLIFDKVTTDILGIPYERQIKVFGSDLSIEMYAQISRSIPFVLPNGLRVKRDIVVLDIDYFNLSTNNGFNIDGLIGGEFFKGLVVQINYAKSRIELFNSEKYKPCENCTKHDIQIINHKPYVIADYVPSFKNTSDTSKLKLLLDSGAAITYLLFMESDSSIIVPESTIPGRLGKGLGGDILGLVGKSQYIGVDEYGFQEVITYYHSVDSSIIAKNKIDRNGIIGNAVLSRFKKVTIDYTYQKLYLEPNKKFNADFQYDKSGINLIALGPDLDQYYVNAVLINSPSYEAGIRPGDLIVKYGWWSTKWHSLEGISNRLCKKEGKKINLTIKRGEKKLKKTFILRDLFLNNKQ
ncbi:MAG: aspartyl protease family protein [Saprospiraceae bacterium]